MTRILNIPSWFDWERMKSFSLFVGVAFLRLFNVKPNVSSENAAADREQESFNDAQRALNLSNADLLNRQKALFRLSIFMMVLSFLIFIYAGYHLYYGAIRASLISLVIMMIAVALAFRYHFWYYQIKSRKLGCSVQEWFKKGLLGGEE